LDNKGYYSRYLASAPGVKVGGWPRSALLAPSCKACQWKMDFLLKIDTSEWTPENAPRWRPRQDSDDSLPRRAACGLAIRGGTAVEVFLCRRCNPWTIRAMVV
jgi:hypothetical protein